MSITHFNPANLNSDLEVLIQAREKNKYLLCLSGGKLSSSAIQYDNREAKRDYSAWTGTLICGVATTISSYMGYDYDDNKVLSYLKELVNYLENNKETLSCINKDTVRKINNCFLSLSDSYSAYHEEGIRDEKWSTTENAGSIAIEYSRLATDVNYLIPR